MDELDLPRDNLEFFRLKQQVHVKDVTYLTKFTFDTMSLEATVNIRDLKKHLASIEVRTFGKA